MFLSENLQEKWQPILEHSDLPKIEDNYKRAVTAVILENQEKALQEQNLQEAAPLNATGTGISNCCLLYTSPSPRDATLSRMPSSA